MALNEGMNVGRRRFVYGTNVGVNVAVATAVLIVVIILGGRFKKNIDLTNTARNSLSPNTMNLLSQIDGDISVTAFLAPPATADEGIKRRQDAIRDLLELYETTSGGKVTATIIDPYKEESRKRRVLNRLLSKPGFEAETQRLGEFEQQFLSLNSKVGEVAEKNAAIFESLKTKLPALIRLPMFNRYSNSLSQLVTSCGQVTESVAGAQSASAEDLMFSAKVASSFLPVVGETVVQYQQWLNKAIIPLLAEADQELLNEIVADYDALLKELTTMQRQIPAEDDLKLVSLLSRLGQYASMPILVESPTGAQIVDVNDLWAVRSAVGVGGKQSVLFDFVGERSISSAILKLTQTQKIGVIFVRFGGLSLLEPTSARRRGEYEGTEIELQRENFLVAEWDVRMQSTPPTIEGASDYVYIVLPPMPREAGDAGMNSSDIEAVTSAIDASGKGIFLASAMPLSKQSTILTEFPYEDFLKTQWGIDVLYRYIARRFAPIEMGDSGSLWTYTSNLNRNDDSLAVYSPQWVHFTSHPISEPLQASMGYFTLVCPILAVDGEMPAGVSLEAVAETVETERIWAVADTDRANQEIYDKGGTTIADGDIVTPFPIAVAGTRSDGAKVVVIGSQQFSTDRYTQLTEGVLIGNRREFASRFPANLGLILNSLHWLTGNTHRIAVAPQQGDVPVLSKLEDGPATRFCKYFVLIIWPTLVLIAGGFVWSVRRK